jgi:hypothetical protein
MGGARNLCRYQPPFRAAMLGFVCSLLTSAIVAQELKPFVKQEG